MTVDPVVYRGALVALAGPERFWLIAPWLLERPADDPHVRFVVVMCHCRRQVEIGKLPGPFTSQLAELWARCILIDSDEHWHLSDADLAAAFGLPLEQVSLARAERSAGPTEL